MSDPPVFLFSLFNGVFVSLDHLLDHLTADRACFAGGQVTVVALLQVDADLIASCASGTTNLLLFELFLLLAIKNALLHLFK